jgi:hypothetical protein
MCEQWNAPVLGKGRMDRAEALVEPGNVELRGHGGGWAVQRDGGDLLLRHDVSGMAGQPAARLRRARLGREPGRLPKISTCKSAHHFKSIQAGKIKISR